MPKRIAFITHSPYPIEPRARRMAEALAERGYAVDVFCLRWPGEPETDRVKGVTIYRLPVARRQGGGRLAYVMEYLRSFLLMAWHVTRHHLRQRYALAQVYNPPDILTFSTLVPRLLSGMRVMLDVRDMAPELFMSRFGLSLEHPITRTLRGHRALGLPLRRCGHRLHATPVRCHGGPRHRGGENGHRAEHAG